VNPSKGSEIANFALGSQARGETIKDTLADLEMNKARQI
jgi:hypothetical protein